MTEITSRECCTSSAANCEFVRYLYQLRFDFDTFHTHKRNSKTMNLFTPTKRASTTASTNLTPVSPIATEVSYLLQIPYCFCIL